VLFGRSQMVVLSCGSIMKYRDSCSLTSNDIIMLFIKATMQKNIDCARTSTIPGFIAIESLQIEIYCKFSEKFIRLQLFYECF